MPLCLWSVCGTFVYIVRYVSMFIPFVCEYPVSRASFVERLMLSPELSSRHDKNPLTINVRVYVWNLNYSPLIYILIHMKNTTDFWLLYTYSKVLKSANVIPTTLFFLKLVWLFSVPSNFIQILAQSFHSPPQPSNFPSPTSCQPAESPLSNTYFPNCTIKHSLTFTSMKTGK